MSGDGLPGPTDSWVTLAGLARETSTIRLGTMVTSATFRHPGPPAISVAQVDAMSGGRVDQSALQDRRTALGVGADDESVGEGGHGGTSFRLALSWTVKQSSFARLTKSTLHSRCVGGDVIELQRERDGRVHTHQDGDVRDAIMTEDLDRAVVQALGDVAASGQGRG